MELHFSAHSEETTGNKNLQFLPSLDYLRVHKQIWNKLFSKNTLSLIHIFVAFPKLRTANI